MIKQLPGGSVIATGPHIRVAQLIATIGALKLEMKGIRASRHYSAYAVLKKRYNFKGSRAKVLQQAEQLLDTLKANPGAIEPQ